MFVKCETGYLHICFLYRKIKNTRFCLHRQKAKGANRPLVLIVVSVVLDSPDMQVFRGNAVAKIIQDELADHPRIIVVIRERIVVIGFLHFHFLQVVGPKPRCYLNQILGAVVCVHHFGNDTILRMRSFQRRTAGAKRFWIFLDAPSALTSARSFLSLDI